MLTNKMGYLYTDEGQISKGSRRIQGIGSLLPVLDDRKDDNMQEVKS
jgi:hypothetical protein